MYSISNFSNSAVCNSASIASTELCELVLICVFSETDVVAHKFTASRQEEEAAKIRF